MTTEASEIDRLTRELSTAQSQVADLRAERDSSSAEAERRGHLLGRALDLLDSGPDEMRERARVLRMAAGALAFPLRIDASGTDALLAEVADLRVRLEGVEGAARDLVAALTIETDGCEHTAIPFGWADCFPVFRAVDALRAALKGEDLSPHGGSESGSVVRNKEGP